MSKRYLISEELRDELYHIVREKADLLDKHSGEERMLEGLYNLPEAKTLDLSGLERIGFEDESSDRLTVVENGLLVRFSDLANLVHTPTGPDVSPLVEALEKIAKPYMRIDEQFSYFAKGQNRGQQLQAEIAREALSAYRGGK